MDKTREIHLKSRPVGLPARDNFEIVETTLAEPAPGEVTVQNLWMAIDPYMRLLMTETKGYARPVRLGQPLVGGAVGEVRISRDPAFLPGDIVESQLGWRESFTAPISSVRKLDVSRLPPQAFLGVAGTPGLTAYFGILRVANLRKDDVVFVSGGAGVVGSVACQIARLKGSHVIASAGGPAKGAFLKEIGVEQVIDYKKVDDLSSAVLRAAPDGIDVYFENVGGAHLEAAIEAARPAARFALCGLTSTYNDPDENRGPRNLFQVITKGLRLEGFSITANLRQNPGLLAEFREELHGWVADGRITWRETVFDGLAAAPEALTALFQGAGMGKILVRLA